MKQLMLFTKDEETANNLKKEGFTLLSKTADGWTFISVDGHMEKLSKKDLQNVAVTNKLCI